MKYTLYSEEDFLLDEYFQKWILNPDSMTTNFWENWVLENPQQKDVVQRAAHLIRLMKRDDQEVLSDKDFGLIWQNVISRRKESGWDNLHPKKVFHSKRNNALWIWMAATFAGVISSVLLMNQFNLFDTNEINELVTNSDIILKLDDGTIKVLDEVSSRTLTDGNGERIVSQKQNKLIYGKSKKKEPEVVDYNELIVPYGKTFELSLSDGSQVLINSGSTIRYPVVFLSDQPRTVYLDGEAYFSIEKDESRPFTVITDDMSTRVYGTKFNVSSYGNEKNTSTVLVEGSVSVYDANNLNQLSIKIKPGQRASMENGLIVVDRVNVNKFIAWTDGRLYFSEDTFENILKKLERRFNVNIENEVKSLNKKRFTGTFTSETLGEILSVIQEHTGFEYQVDGSTITIIEKNN